MFIVVVSVSVFRCLGITSDLGRNSLVGDAASWVGPDPELPAEGIFPLEFTWVLTPFPKTLLDDSINQGLVCAHMHSIAWTQKMMTFMS